jgi:hypothetical protein
MILSPIPSINDCVPHMIVSPIPLINDCVLFNTMSPITMDVSARGIDHLLATIIHRPPFDNNHPSILYHYELLRHEEHYPDFIYSSQR